MSEFIEPPPGPETPWEFYPDDDLREDPEMAAEDAAMHVETTRVISEVPPDDLPQTVHYLDDEEPEVPDHSEPRSNKDTTPEVEDLLIRQHYMSPKNPRKNR